MKLFRLDSIGHEDSIEVNCYVTDTNLYSFYYLAWS